MWGEGEGEERNYVEFGIVVGDLLGAWAEQGRFMMVTSGGVDINVDVGFSGRGKESASEKQEELLGEWTTHLEGIEEM